MEDPKVRIKNHDIPLFLAAGLFFDGLQVVMVPIYALPFLGVPLGMLLPLLVTATAFILFSLWFALKRVNYFTGKKAAEKVLILFTTLGVELLPFVTALPAITGGVALMIFASRVEDTVGKKRKLEGMVRRKEREERRTDFSAGVARGAFGAIGMQVTGNRMATSMQQAQQRKHTARANMYAARAYQGRKDIQEGDPEAKTGIQDMKRLGGAMNRRWMQEGPARQRDAENIEKMYDVIPRRKMSESRRLLLERYNRRLNNCAIGIPTEE